MNPLFGLRNCFLITLLLGFLSPSFSQELSSDPAVISAGEKLFQANCKACHRVKKKLIGPALAGVEERAPSLEWIVHFVRNSSKVIASGDEYANKIYEENNKTLMTAFTSFSDEQIMSIISYVKSEAEKPDAVQPAAAAQSAGGAGSINTDYLYIIVTGMFTVLILLLIALVLVIRGLQNYLRQRDLNEADREVITSPYSLGRFLKSPGFSFLVVFLVVSIGFKFVIDSLYAIGIQQGYQPKQPIAFSHEVHAGQYEIDCKYCHTGAMHSRSANIPGVAVCMNCHTQIRKGTNTGEVEIAKIVKAYETNTPVVWNRVHNLPDLAYFNHSQHVNVGGIECQTCHGPVEEMAVIRQYAPLTMGWCVDCHRKTDINTKGNKYYDHLLEVHNDKAMKVADVGGIECAKCHY